MGDFSLAALSFLGALLVHVTCLALSWPVASVITGHQPAWLLDDHSLGR
jgi:ABC-type spermidine/putrescine transport system permease subunit I